MKILVANLGSTSFKYRLFDMEENRQLARGGIERIGSSESKCSIEVGDHEETQLLSAPDHAVAVQHCLAQLTHPDYGCLATASEVSAIGFKAVHGGRLSGVQRINEDVLSAMEEMNGVAPAHNPPYIKAMRLLNERLPNIPLVAAFETGFHQTIPSYAKTYAIPHEWTDTLQVKRWGFHGASHRYIGQRTAELMIRENLRIISCHLGGSSSLCAIRNGQSIGTTMGMSPQSGLPQNNRVGDFDPFALPRIIEATGLSLAAVLDKLANNGGLLGVSGVSGDIRDLEEAASAGNERAQLALDMYVFDIRRHFGGLLVQLGGADAIVFTGGIGENGKRIRARVCEGLAELGIELDSDSNQRASGEMEISAEESKCEIWVIPTNEELIVASQAKELLETGA